jgi:hypothetical protein
MRILVTTIPFTGMKIDAPISQRALNDRLNEGSAKNYITFEAAPLVDITLTRTYGGVLVKGIVSGLCKQDCGSCGELVPHQVTANIDWVLQGQSDRAAPDDLQEDTGVIAYSGDHVDLEEYLQEALILALSPYWHPPRDPQDVCSVCRRDCSRRSWRMADDAVNGGSDGTVDSKKGDKEVAKQDLGALLEMALKGKR